MFLIHIPALKIAAKKGYYILFCNNLIIPVDMERKLIENETLIQYENSEERKHELTQANKKILFEILKQNGINKKDNETYTLCYENNKWELLRTEKCLN